jgi:hypothetical protein
MKREGQAMKDVLNTIYTMLLRMDDVKFVQRMNNYDLRMIESFTVVPGPSLRAVGRGDHEPEVCVDL